MPGGTVAYRPATAATHRGSLEHPKTGSPPLMAALPAAIGTTAVGARFGRCRVSCDDDPEEETRPLIVSHNKRESVGLLHDAPTSDRGDVGKNQPCGTAPAARTRVSPVTAAGRPEPPRSRRLVISSTLGRPALCGRPAALHVERASSQPDRQATVAVGAFRGVDRLNAIGPYGRALQRTDRLTLREPSGAVRRPRRNSVGPEPPRSLRELPASAGRNSEPSRPARSDRRSRRRDPSRYGCSA